MACSKPGNPRHTADLLRRIRRRRSHSLPRNTDMTPSPAPLIANDFHKHALASFPIEFTIKNLFPRPQIQLALRDRDHHFASHDLALEMRIGVVFAGAIVAVL